MKLRSIRLNNVRRFTEPVEITGIKPGLNVLSAANEQGKSTILDALYALFFKDAKSFDKDIKSLIPHAGGDPEISAEIELDGAVYDITKIFSKSARKGVKIRRDGHLFKQAGEAEEWLEKLMKAPKEGGPAGLLWVHQGLTSFQDATDTLSARRDLLASVTGEVESLTGGRQMEALRADVGAALEVYLTKTGKAKTGGPLFEAKALADALAATREELSEKTDELRGFLDRKRVLKSELSSLQSPEAAAARRTRLDTTKKAAELAERHQDKLDQAETTAKMAQAQCQSNQQSIVTQSALLREHATASDDKSTAKQASDEASAALETANAALTHTRQKDGDARRAFEQAQAQVNQVHQAEAAKYSAEKRQRFVDLLAQAEAQRTRIDTEKARVALGPNERVMTGIEAAETDRLLALRTREAAALSVTVVYEPEATTRVHLEGQPLPDKQRMPLPLGGDLDISGVGRLQIRPGEAAESGAVLRAETVLARALEQAKFATLDAARRAASARTKASAEQKAAHGALALIAPSGIDALRTQLAALPQETFATADLPTQDAAEAVRAQASTAQKSSEADLEKARILQTDASAEALRAAQAFDGASARLQRATLAVPDPEKARAELAQLMADTRARVSAQAEAQTALQSLKDAAPDLEHAQVAYQRALSAQNGAAKRIHEIDRDLAVLEAQIESLAGKAVEEELAEVTDQLATAQNTLDALQFEVDVLRKLDAALLEAQQSARDHYIGPIFRELKPLVQMVWPDAELIMDADSLLPARFVRPGSEDDFSQLSGGTQEQIALLVRLAFARLLARSGTPTPVILDDAIVYTDDDRIEKMFDALTRQAADLQIIVFSCRQRVFRDLGGQNLTIRQVTP